MTMARVDMHWINVAFQVLALSFADAGAGVTRPHEYWHQVAELTYYNDVPSSHFAIIHLNPLTVLLQVRPNKFLRKHKLEDSLS